MFLLKFQQEQQQIVVARHRNFKSLRSEKVLRDRLQHQNIGLMQDLLTGKVPVKVGAGDTAIGYREHA